MCQGEPIGAVFYSLPWGHLNKYILLRLVCHSNKYEDKNTPNLS